MSSPSELDKEDEDYEPLDEDDDEDYRPGRKKRSRKKKKQPPRNVQKSSSQFQFVAEIPIEFDIEPSSNDADLPNKPEDTSNNSKESSNKLDDLSSKLETSSNKLETSSNKLETSSNKLDDSSNKLEASSNKLDDSSDKPEDLSKTSEAASGSTGSEEQSSQEPPKKKPRKMITPQRTRTDTNRKSFIGSPPTVSNSTNNGTTDKDSSALTDSANNIPKITSNSAVNRYPCGYCDTVFTDISFLERHHKRCKAKRTAESISLAQQGPINVTKPISQSYMQPPTARFMYACDKCPFSTKNPEHLKYHRPIHNDEQYYSCDQCKFSCRDVQQLNQHKMLHPGHAGGVSTVRTEEKTVIKQEPSDVSVPNIVKDEKPTIVSPQVPSNDKQEESSVTYTCDQCTYSTSRQSYLMMHKKIHVRDQPYQCKDCGYKCSRLAYFKKHRATHGVTDDALVSCDSCSFITSSQIVLDAHKQCHKI